MEKKVIIENEDNDNNSILNRNYNYDKDKDDDTIKTKNRKKYNIKKIDEFKNLINEQDINLDMSKTYSH